MLFELATGGNGHHLHAPADAQHRAVLLGRDTGERELERVAVGPPGLHRRVRLRGIPAGLDVRPTGEDHPVEAREHLPGQTVVGVDARRDEERNPAGALDLGDVVLRQQRAGDVGPVTTGRRLDVARDADDRAKSVAGHGITPA